MLLKLEVVGAQAGRLGEHRSVVFATEGGTIGRVPGNDWVLPDQFVSSRHAAIQYADGQFYVIDTSSSNGVFLNAPNFRLEQGRPYPIKTGDRLLIDPFEIHVSVIESTSPESEAPQGEPPETRDVERPPPALPISRPSFGSDPFAVEGEPFIGSLPAPSPRSSPRGESLVPTSDDPREEVVDPMAALGFPHASKRPAAPRAEDLARGSPLRSNFELPRITPSRAPPPQEILPPVAAVEPRPAAAIPADYNPLAHTDLERAPLKPAPPTPPPRPPPAAPRSDSRRSAPRAPGPREAPPLRGAPPPPLQRSAPPPPVASSRPRSAPAPLPVRPRPSPPSPPPVPRASIPSAPIPAAARGQLDFAALLSAAGLEGVPITRELAASFGSILKVVVDGLRDVLRAREELKDQFRLKITTYGRRENNPIKFSANTEDALHNLLVRHNPAYLEPVEAFEGAFDDLRIHQMAMLAGLRAGYEAMLASFDPDALEQKFERYAKRGGLLGGATKQRYWELYRDIFQEMAGDADDSFRTLFGKAFGEGYEQQARLLKRRPQGQ